MVKQLSGQQIERYRKDGFVSLPAFLTPDEVGELKQAVLAAVASTEKRKVAGHGAYYDRVWTRRVNLWRVSDTLRRYMLGEDLGRMLCQLSGVDGLRVWHDQALIKEPYANPTAWHLDSPNWSFCSRDSISIWIALDDATLANGCMWFIPGTHEMARYETSGPTSSIDEDLAGLFKVCPEMATINPVAVPMKAGDCSFHNGLTAHGAGANMTRGRRIAMTCAYMPVGSVFNGQQNLLPDDYFRSLKTGDVLENDNWNPLIYSETRIGDQAACRKG